MKRSELKYGLIALLTAAAVVVPLRSVLDSAFREETVLERIRSKPIAAADDVGGDGGADLVMFQSGPDGAWFRARMSAGIGLPAARGESGGVEIAARWPAGPLVPVPGDYDGDGTIDLATYTPGFAPSSGAPGNWRIAFTDRDALARGVSNPSSRTVEYSWGHYDFRAVPGDYDGDKKTDLAVFDPATANWRIAFSGNGVNIAKAAINLPGFGATIQWGLPGDVPVPDDYDGDGKTDPAVARAVDGNYQWFVYSAERRSEPIVFGEVGDILLPADYDGDGRAELAVSSAKGWLIRWSDGRIERFEPCPPPYESLARDYDGDRRADFACYHAAAKPSWRIRLSRPSEVGRKLFGDKGPGDWFPEWNGNSSHPAALLLQRHQRQPGFGAATFFLL